jgi:hypothetical protein
MSSRRFFLFFKAWSDTKFALLPFEAIRGVSFYNDNTCSKA